MSTDVNTYLDEAINRFIRGDLDIDNDAAWQDYLDDLDSPGINTMVEIYAAALERLNSR